MQIFNLPSPNVSDSSLDFPGLHATVSRTPYRQLSSIRNYNHPCESRISLVNEQTCLLFTCEPCAFDINESDGHLELFDGNSSAGYSFTDHTINLKILIFEKWYQLI